METTIAFLLAACAFLYFGPHTAGIALGLLCIALSGVGYAAALLRFDQMGQRRNALVFAGWSAALLLAGCWLCLPQLGQALLLGAAAVASVYAAERWGRSALELHGLVFLLAAAWLSGLGNQIFGSLAATMPAAPSASICVVSLASVVCYAVFKPRGEMIPIRQLLSLALAALAAAVLAAFAVQGLVALASLAVVPEAHHVAFVRTLTVCLAAISLAYSGARWQRIELSRLGHATLALLALKLVLEDLRHGHLAFIAGAIFLFAVTLLTVPRVARIRRKT
jgi:hypothetical protein